MRRNITPHGESIIIAANVLGDESETDETESAWFDNGELYVKTKGSLHLFDQEGDVTIGASAVDGETETHVELCADADQAEALGSALLVAAGRIREDADEKRRDGRIPENDGGESTEPVYRCIRCNELHRGIPDSCSCGLVGKPTFFNDVEEIV